MLSHFWNICGNACPALEMDKLHSEYKSTYRWHTDMRKPNSTATAADPVKSQPNKASSFNKADFLPISRKKKHPDLAYRSHDLFDSSLAPPFPTRSSRAKDLLDNSESRRPRFREFRHHQKKDQPDYRRSQSEGPALNRKSSSKSGINTVTSSSNARSGSSTRNGDLRAAMAKSVAAVNEASAGDNTASNGAVPKAIVRRARQAHQASSEAVAMATSFPPPAPSSKWNERENCLRQIQMKESISMGQLQDSDAMAASAGNLSGIVSEPRLNKDDALDSASSAGGVVSRRSRSTREPRSEYKYRYRPFSNYEYVGDRFIPSPGAGTPPEEVPQSVSSRYSSKASLQGEPWYKEVVELRKRANDYRCRGWGADTAPPHINELYQKQMDLYEQSKRREALSALSLAIASPRCQYDSSVDRVDSSAATISTSSRPPRPTSRPGRPGTAPPANGAVPGGARRRSGHKTTLSSKYRSESAHPVGQGLAGGRRGPTAAAASRTRKASSQQQLQNRSVSANRTKSPPVVVPPPTAQPRKANFSPPPTTNGPEDKADNGKNNGNNNNKRQRPTTLNTSSQHQQHPPRPSKRTTTTTTSTTGGGGATPKRGQQVERMADEQTKAISDSVPALSVPQQQQQPQPPPTKRCPPPSAAPTEQILRQHQRPFSRSSSARTGESRNTSRPTSAIENHMDYFREPVVKSPPEPTRVRSPAEASSVKSPDPINWTVPLDTGKTFSVTHSVKDGESSRNSPQLSDHSSPFDSVSGTAINLGQQQRVMSGLAKSEARDYGPGLTKDSTVMRPALSASTSIERQQEEGLRRLAAAPEEVEAEAAAAETNGLRMPPRNDIMMTGIYVPSTEVNGNNKVGASSSCLEEPNFAFDQPMSAPQPKQPTYRVLEDPAFEAGGGGGGRAVANEVREGAKEKFDRFWSKPAPNSPAARAAASANKETSSSSTAAAAELRKQEE